MSLTLINQVVKRGVRATHAQKPVELVPIDDIADAAVGGRIRAIRSLHHLTQRELAERATAFLPGEHKVTQSDIVRIERNPGRSKFYVLSAVCKALNITVAELTETDLEVIHYDENEKEHEVSIPS